MVRYVNICHVCTATFVHPDNHFGILCIPERERTPETVKFIDFKDLIKVLRHMLYRIPDWPI